MLHSRLWVHLFMQHTLLSCVPENQQCFSNMLAHFPMDVYPCTGTEAYAVLHLSAAAVMNDISALQ